MTRSSRQHEGPQAPARDDAETVAVSRAVVDAAAVLLGETGRPGVLHLTGGSMRPILHEGQRIHVEFSPRRLAIGDVVVFRRDHYLIVHRLVARTSGQLFTRGDAVPRLDQDGGPRLDAAGVLGRVTAFEQAGATWDLRTPAARAYARMIAWHDRFWAALGRLATRGDLAVGRLGLTARLRPTVAGVDRRLLRVVHRLLFRRVHRLVALPVTPPGELA